MLNPVQRSAFIDAIGAWGRLINLDLVEVADNAGGQGQIRIAFTDTDDDTDTDNAAAYAYQPPLPGGLVSAFNGDIWVDDDYKADNVDLGGSSTRPSCTSSAMPSG